MDYFNFLGKFILFIKIYNYNILLIELFDNQQPKITNATLRIPQGRCYSVQMQGIMNVLFTY